MGLEAYGLSIKEIKLNNDEKLQEVKELLNSLDLKLDFDVDYVLGVYDGKKLIGTGSKASYVLKCFAIKEEYRGDGILEALTTELINKCFEEGLYHQFIFTKKRNAYAFMGACFKLLCETEEVSLLENGMFLIDDYLNEIKKKYDLGEKEYAAVVVNCNPMTLGHMHLIREASNRFKNVIVFVVSEDKSIFPTEVRVNLVKEALKEFKNVKVIEGGPYIISSATFPSYFLREESVRHLAFTKIDSTIFGKYISKGLNVKSRIVGKEPFSISTRIYNDTLKSILPSFGVELIEIERLEVNGTAVSASNVRELLKEGKLEEIKKLVPPAVYNFLKTKEGGEIIRRLMSLKDDYEKI